jgi:hypothetical protein
MWFVSWKKVPGAASEPIPEYPIATMEPLTVLVLYSLRFCVIFSVVILWVVAVSDVGSHIRKGSFTAAQLVSMAVAVSVIAVGAIVALNATVPSHGGTGLDQKGQPPWFRPDSGARLSLTLLPTVLASEGLRLCLRNVWQGTPQSPTPVRRVCRGRVGRSADAGLGAWTRTQRLSHILDGLITISPYFKAKRPLRAGEH